MGRYIKIRKSCTVDQSVLYEIKSSATGMKGIIFAEWGDVRRVDVLETNLPDWRVSSEVGMALFRLNELLKSLPEPSDEGFPEILDFMS